MNQQINEGMEGRIGGRNQEGQWGPESCSEILGVSTGTGKPRQVSEKSDLLWKALWKKIPIRSCNMSCWEIILESCHSVSKRQLQQPVPQLTPELRHGDHKGPRTANGVGRALKDLSYFTISTALSPPKSRFIRINSPRCSFLFQVSSMK